MLPVDHLRPRNPGSDDSRDVQDNGAEEMRPPRSLPLSVETDLRLPLDILPKRLPLPLLAPDICTLIERHDVTALTLEELVDRQLVRLQSHTP
ncbi:hypothetical protein D3C86_1603740 [compost metagenome]